MSVELHAAVAGSGPYLVLLHPVGLDHTFWGALATLPGHRVVSVDLRGHGASPLADRDTTLDDFADDVHAAIASHCRGPATVLGLSFGGMLAQTLALRHPADVAALVLCGCSGGFAPEIRPVLRERGLAAERGGMAAVVEPTIERWFTATFRDDPEVARVRARLHANDVASWSAAWHAIATLDAFDRLAAVRVPTLVIAGEADVATPLAAATRLAACVPNARLQVVPGAPHMMQIERSADYRRVVQDFLGELNG